MNQSLRAPFLLLLSLMCLYALFSVGFLHPDEHYQVIEYMNVFMGRFESSILSTLEWNALMRPWFQAIVYSVPISLIRNLFGLYPFIEVMLMRFFSIALALCWIWPLIRESLIQNADKFTSGRDKVLLATFILPVFTFVLSARTSSDTVSAHLFLIALTRIGLPFHFKGETARLLEFSVLAGISILVRYQMVLWVGLSYLWFIKEKKWGLKAILGFGALTLAIASLEFPFNYLGRGLWYSSSVNHIVQNIFHGVAATFGVMPWWGYFVIFFKNGAPPLSLLYLYLSFRFVIKRRQTLTALLVVVSFIFFSLIGHKEGRFLTPTIFLSSFVLALASRDLKKKLVVAVGAISLALTFIMSFHPTYRPILTYRAIDKEVRANEVIKVMKDRSGRELRFELHHYQRFPWQTESYDEASTGLIVSSTYAQYTLLKERECELKSLSYPEFILFNNSFKWRDRSNIWGVWRCFQAK